MLKKSTCLDWVLQLSLSCLNSFFKFAAERIYRKTSFTGNLHPGIVMGAAAKDTSAKSPQRKSIPRLSRASLSNRVTCKRNKSIMRGKCQPSITKYVRTYKLSSKEEEEWQTEVIDLDIHRAAAEGNVELLRILLQLQGADPNSRGPGGKTALHYAASSHSSQPVMFGLLLVYGADIEALDADGRTPLSLAAMEGHLKAVQTLLAEGASIEAVDNNGDTPLHLAAWRGSLETVETLLSQGGDLKAKGRYGWTPLFRAVAGGHLGVVKLLLDAGADRGAKNIWGSTPYHIALRLQHFELLPLLSNGFQACLNNGCEIEEKGLSVIQMYLSTTDTTDELNISLTSTGFTEGSDSKIHQATCEGNIDTLDSLLKNGVDPNSKGPGGKTPLHLVAIKFSSNVMGLLVAYGADIDSKDDGGRTPLHLACKLGRMKAVRTLLVNGAGKETKDKNGDTPLHFAAWSGSLEIVGLLLSRRVAINSRGRYGWTPLFRAVVRGHQRVVRVLLKAGADRGAKNSWGSTPLDVASRLGLTDIMNLLGT